MALVADKNGVELQLNDYDIRNAKEYSKQRIRCQDHFENDDQNDKKAEEEGRRSVRRQFSATKS